MFISNIIVFSIPLVLSILSCNTEVSNVASPIPNPFESTKRTSCLSITDSKTPDLIWKVQFTENALAATMDPIVTDSFVIISRSSDFNPPDEILCYSKSNGALVWKWFDYFNSVGNVLNEFYIYSNRLIICTSGSLYIIDINTGETIFRKKYGDHNKTGTSGNSNFVAFTYSNSQEYVAAILNLETMRDVTCLVVPKSSEFKGSLSVPYIVENSLFVSFNKYVFANNSNISELYKFDLQQDSLELMWRKTITGNGTIGNFGFATIGSNLFFADRNLYSLQISDGATNWEVPDVFGGPGELIIADYKLLVTSNHLNPSLMAFNLNNGELLWNENISGTSSLLQFHNCVIYTVGGGDGLLHAIDSYSGKHLYKLKSPDEQLNSNLYFDNCTIDKTTNSLFITNYQFLIKYKLPDY